MVVLSVTACTAMVLIAFGGRSTHFTPHAARVTPALRAGTRPFKANRDVFKGFGLGNTGAPTPRPTHSCIETGDCDSQDDDDQPDTPTAMPTYGCVEGDDCVARPRPTAVPTYRTPSVVPTPTPTNVPSREPTSPCRRVSTDDRALGDDHGDCDHPTAAPALSHFGTAGPTHVKDGPIWDDDDEDGSRANDDGDDGAGVANSGTDDGSDDGAGMANGGTVPSSKPTHSCVETGDCVPQADDDQPGTPTAKPTYGCVEGEDCIARPRPTAVPTYRTPSVVPTPTPTNVPSREPTSPCRRVSTDDRAFGDDHGDCDHPTAAPALSHIGTASPSFAKDGPRDDEDDDDGDGSRANDDGDDGAGVVNSGTDDGDDDGAGVANGNTVPTSKPTHSCVETGDCDPQADDDQPDTPTAKPTYGCVEGEDCIARPRPTTVPTYHAPSVVPTPTPSVVPTPTPTNVPSREPTSPCRRVSTDDRALGDDHGDCDHPTAAPALSHFGTAGPTHVKDGPIWDDDDEDGSRANDDGDDGAGVANSGTDDGSDDGAGMANGGTVPSSKPTHSCVETGDCVPQADDDQPGTPTAKPTYGCVEGEDCIARPRPTAVPTYHAPSSTPTPMPSVVPTPTPTHVPSREPTSPCRRVVTDDRAFGDDHGDCNHPTAAPALTDVRTVSPTHVKDGPMWDDVDDGDGDDNGDSGDYDVGVPNGGTDDDGDDSAKSGTANDGDNDVVVTNSGTADDDDDAAHAAWCKSHQSLCR